MLLFQFLSGTWKLSPPRASIILALIAYTPGQFLLNMAGVLFEDIFDVKDIDPEGKKFDRGESSLPVLIFYAYGTIYKLLIQNLRKSRLQSGLCPVKFWKMR